MPDGNETNIISGSAFCCGDNVTAYQIIDQPRWALGLNPDELGKWAMEGACPEIQDVEYGFRDLGHRILVAGRDFGGGGKSIEHPIVALQGAGIRLLLADSFSRYCFRNAINLGLPAILCPGVSAMVSSGDALSADLLTGKVTNLTTGGEIQGSPLPPLVLQFVESGGMLNHFRARLQEPSQSEYQG